MGRVTPDAPRCYSQAEWAEMQGPPKPVRPFGTSTGHCLYCGRFAPLGSCPSCGANNVPYTPKSVQVPAFRKEWA